MDFAYVVNKTFDAEVGQYPNAPTSMMQYNLQKLKRLCTVNKNWSIPVMQNDVKHS